LSGFPATTSYDFEPTYSSTPLNPRQLITFQWRRMVVDMAISQVRCVGNLRGITDACRDFEHNDQLIRRVRCDNCRYHANVPPPRPAPSAQVPNPPPREEPQPMLDYTTCNCRIVAGELVEGEGPFMRTESGGVMRSAAGVERRLMPEYRLVTSREAAVANRENLRGNIGNTDGERIRVVCEPGANGAPQNNDYNSCRVELTIEQCPLVHTSDTPASPQVATRESEAKTYSNGRPVRRCYAGTDATETDDGSYTRDSNGNLQRFPVPTTATTTATTTTTTTTTTSDPTGSG